jgi:hypothetical protein
MAKRFNDFAEWNEQILMVDLICIKIKMQGERFSLQPAK